MNMGQVDSVSLIQSYFGEPDTWSWRLRSRATWLSSGGILGMISGGTGRITGPFKPEWQFHKAKERMALCMPNACIGMCRRCLIRGLRFNPQSAHLTCDFSIFSYINIQNIFKSNSAPRSKLRSMFAPFVISRNPVGSSAYSLLSLQGFPGSQRNCGLCPP